MSRKAPLIDHRSPWEAKGRETGWLLGGTKLASWSRRVMIFLIGFDVPQSVAGLRTGNAGLWGNHPIRASLRVNKSPHNSMEWSLPPILAILATDLNLPPSGSRFCELLHDFLKLYRGFKHHFPSLSSRFLASCPSLSVWDKTPSSSFWPGENASYFSAITCFRPT